MCLIKSVVHINNYSKPFVAEKDIIVYKALNHRTIFGDKYIYTPYMACTINFIDGKCVMASKMKKCKLHYVEKGLHSYITEERIKRRCKISPETKMTKHWAVIPKGSEYFIGTGEEIVSTELIIFKTREDFRKYRKEHKCVKINLHD